MKRQIIAFTTIIALLAGTLGTVWIASSHTATRPNLTLNTGEVQPVTCADGTLPKQHGHGVRRDVFCPTATVAATHTPVPPTATATNTAIPATATVVPPTATTVPVTATATPQAGTACPTWVHAQHTTTGPDGATYPTWHPAIDATYGCYFGHEHGSNPDKVTGAHMPAYGYGTPSHMTESHYGFKTKALWLENGVKILATVHFGTANPEIAVCQRHHFANFQFVQNGELVADITFMADFGAAVRNDTNEPLDHACLDHVTGTMKTQAQIAQETSGARLNPVGTGGPFYYPWRMSASGNVLGFVAGSYTVNTPGVVAACATMQCNARVIIGDDGIWAFASATTGWGIRAGANTGTFYTDLYGKVIVSETTPGAVQQYVKPGIDIRLTKNGDTYSYFPDSRHGGAYGDYVYTQMANGNVNINGNVDAVVNPTGIPFSAN